MVAKRVADAAGLGATFRVEVALDRAISEIDAGWLLEKTGRHRVAHQDDVSRLFQLRPNLFGSRGGLRRKQEACMQN